MHTIVHVINKRRDRRKIDRDRSVAIDRKKLPTYGGSARKIHDTKEGERERSERWRERQVCMFPLSALFCRSECVSSSSSSKRERAHNLALACSRARALKKQQQQPLLSRCVPYVAKSTYVCEQQ